MSAMDNIYGGYEERVRAYKNEVAVIVKTMEGVYESASMSATIVTFPDGTVTINNIGYVLPPEQQQLINDLKNLIERRKQHYELE